MEAEIDSAYKFIIDREIEAPDRFQAIQSYRAAMALTRQQINFVQELFDTGMYLCGKGAGRSGCAVCGHKTPRVLKGSAELQCCCRVALVLEGWHGWGALF